MTLPNSLLSSAVIAVIIVIVSGYVISYSVGIDTVADILFTGMLNAAYAAHVVLSLNATDSIDNLDGGTLELDGAWDIATFKSGVQTYAIVTASNDAGVQILNITDPSKITAAGSIMNSDDLELDGPRGMATFESGTDTYAIVAAYTDDGVQILNITSPTNILPAGNITDNSTDLKLKRATDIAVFKSGTDTYAAVTAETDDGVQILNITNPASIAAADSIADDGTNADSIELNGARGIATFKSGGHTYAAVAANADNGVQILNITNPYIITTAGSITNNSTLNLDAPTGITIFDSTGGTYAAITSETTTNTIQILNITNPSNITPAGSIDNTANLELDGAWGITTFKSGDHVYAAVAANRDDGVQILDVTDPSNITPVSNIMDNSTNLELNGAIGITIFNSNGNTYAAVASHSDDGVQIIRIDIAEPDTTPPVADAGDFVTTWRTTTAGESITLPLVGTDITVDWGDGNTTTGVLGSVSHPYAAAGDHTVSITGGLTGINMLQHADAPKLLSIDQWGDASWTSFEYAFWGTLNMVYNATDEPDLSGVTSMTRMFARASAFTGNLSSWDVSSVSDMSYMFFDTSTFNGNISGWNVSKVTNMSYMFRDATSFTGNISGWDVSSATKMISMFRGATSFDGDISGWNVSQATRMQQMFFGATSFDGDISGWDVSKVTDMEETFSGATSFDGDISGWDVSKVTDMEATFFGATSFTGNISGWDVSKVTDMRQMFFGATSFNGDLSSWDVSSVINMFRMFNSASSFDQNLGNWYVTLDPDTIASTGIPGVVGTLSAQNQPLKDHTPTYGIVDGLDKNHFEIISGNRLNMTSGVPGEYSINVTASGGSVFESDNNWRLLEIKVTGQTTDTTLPADAFATTWRTTTADESITLPISGSGMTVDWGDGNTTTGVSGTRTHNYTNSGDHTVIISGDLTGISINDHRMHPNCAR